MEDRSALIKRVNELAQRTYQNNYTAHTYFLTAAEQACVLEAAGPGTVTDAEDGMISGRWKNVPWILYGGFPEAERRVLCFLPDYLDAPSFRMQEDAAPEVITCLQIEPVNRRFAEELTHRDYLGALMHLGIERERIGDILTEGSSAFLCVMKDNAEVICRELIRVRHTGTVCREVPFGACSLQQQFEEREGSVASERLDAVLAMVYHLSRGRAQELIEEELVFVDGRTAFSGGYDLKTGSRVSVRGYGKFQYLGAGAQTKKGRHYARVKLWK